MDSTLCPQRGPGLSHAHASDCIPQNGHPRTGVRHEWNECCHCGIVVGAPPTTIRTSGEPEPLPPLDVTARLRQLGLLPTVKDFPFSVVRTDLPVPEEPKMAQGTYPGPDWGPGRGDLTPRQAKALVARVGWVLWLRSRTGNET
jgi:hypothetical protein